MSGVEIGPASLVRAAGVAGATVLSSPLARLAALAGTYAGAWQVKPGGLTFLSMTDSDHENPLVREYLPLATSGASWTAVHLGVTTLLRRRSRHRLLAAVGYGAAVALLDSVMAQKFEALKAAAAKD
ncbi:MAG: hypothetical protein ABIO16_06825 [Nocardioides sp.]